MPQLAEKIASTGVSLNPLNFSSSTFQYLEQVSYCPQSSGIIPQLSGREFLELFARLRGFREPQVADAVHHWIKILDLQVSIYIF